MKTRSSKDGSRLADLPGSALPSWRQWLVRVALFAVMFVALITAFAALSRIVEGFFVTLYGN